MPNNSNNSKKDQLEAILEEATENAKKAVEEIDPNKATSKNETGSKTTSSNSSSSKGSGSGRSGSGASSTSTVNKSVVSIDTLNKTLAGNFKQLGEGFHKSIMEMGQQLTGQFQELREELAQSQEYEEEDYWDYEMDEEEEIPGDDTGKGDDEFLDSIALNEEDELGPEVGTSLARLSKKFLGERMDPNSYKKKVETYKIPKNVVEAVSVPAMNPQIYEVLPPYKRHLDLGLQKIQKDMLLSSLPTMKVLGLLLEAKDEPGNLDFHAAIKHLTDSLAFLGSSNTNLIEQRKLNIKFDLPQNVRPIVQQGVSSPNLLFGNDLSSQLKEVGELNRMSLQLNGPNNRPGSRGGFRGTRGRGAWRRGFRRGRARWTPYGRGKSLNKKPALNKQGSSNSKP